MGHCSLSRDPTSGGSGETHSFLLQEEWHGSMLQEYAVFGDSKWGHVPEIEMLYHRLDELRVWPETRKTGRTESFFLRTH